MKDVGSQSLHPFLMRKYGLNVIMKAVTSPDYRVFVLNDKNGMCPKYYLYMMQMCYSARIFYGLGQGVSGMGRWRLQADKFLNFYIPIPPYDEQKKIADYITDRA